MITEALLTTVENWKQNKCSSLKKTGKHRYIECQMNKLDPYVSSNINFKAIMFSENKKCRIYIFILSKHFLKYTG